MGTQKNRLNEKFLLRTQTMGFDMRKPDCVQSLLRANNKIADQPGHLYSPISAFVINCVESMQDSDLGPTVCKCY